MPTMSRMPRTRRRRTAIQLGPVLVAAGTTAATSAVIARAGPITAAGVGLVLLGVLLSGWGGRGLAAATAHDRARLAASGRADDLPPGARYDDQGLIALSTSRRMSGMVLAASVTCTLLGSAMAWAVPDEPAARVASLGVLVLAALLAILWGWVRGIQLWLLPEGVVRERWPWTRVAWGDVTEVTLEDRGATVTIRAPGRVQSALKADGDRMRIAANSLEISAADLRLLVLHLNASRQGAARPGWSPPSAPQPHDSAGDGGAFPAAGSSWSPPPAAARPDPPRPAR